MHWWGLIILSIAVGHRYEQAYGWMVLGGGMVLSFSISSATVISLLPCEF